MSIKIGNPQTHGDPGRPGVVIVKMRGRPGEEWARTDGTRIGFGQRSQFDARQIDLVDGRLPAYRVCQRSAIEYWRAVDIVEEREPVQPAEPTGWLARLKAATAKLLGR